jgi:SpoVK/Ycf46/Vps4 family AAA+-type ATPase
MDPAFLRRFDIAVELPNPPRQVRRRILKNSLDGLPVPTGWIDRIVQNDHVTPADVDRAVAVARVIGTDAADATGRTIEQVLAGRLTVRSQPARVSDYGLDRETYDLAFLNADRDVEQLVGALERCRRGSLCLYGPPGTGKTALAHYLAERLGRPLVARRASDLLHPYMGMTEKLIAEMFRETEAQDAVLLLDEADSFLRDRREAVRSWEVTQVNELLCQMEGFQGVFVCSTNLWQTLDEASVRRFQLKIEFRFLRPDQSAGLFQRTLTALGCPPPDEETWSRIRKGLQRIDNLTPGDFATVRRQAPLLPELTDATELLGRLEQESRAKREQARDNPIGFGP